MLKMSARTRKAVPALTLGKCQAKALLMLVDYAFREERRHFYEEEPQHRRRHIFHEICIVALAVGYTTKAHLRILERQDVELHDDHAN